MRPAPFPLLIALLFAAASARADPLSAPDSAPTPPSVRDEVESGITLYITINVVKEGKVVWQNRTVRIAQPGISLPIRIEGGNASVGINLIPFPRPGNQRISIVIRAESWIDTQDGPRYLSSMNQVTVKYGKTVKFFPLGLDPMRKHAPNIIVEVCPGERMHGAREKMHGANEEPTRVNDSLKK